MSRQLLLLRHAKSHGPDEFGSDFERELNQQGRESVQNMALWMQSEQLIPDYIVSSDAQRARQTTLQLCQHAKLSDASIGWEHEIYDASLGTLLKVLSRVPATSRTALLVGHNPVSNKWCVFSRGDSLAQWDEANLVPTATLIQVSMPANWDVLDTASASVIHIARPRQLFEY